ncbi:AsmA-like C-terminal region-containing protein [Xanthobacter oligotrophicus]|uniref:AsmA family protein n=1 Tax=Xanthobacter oligotrophicus TaxID=2607286 RepID=UPI0011F0C89E|nr:AsmA-like C-terminal region-containing protein [Xanthobacter oligotrophicus]MCG5237536.1 AsmA family protein [Xanthobacter oligotrophicus]
MRATPFAIGAIKIFMLRLGKNARRAGVVVAIVVGAVTVALLAVTAALPLVVPGAELRRIAVHALAGSTGQKVVILGEPALRLFPSPRVVLGKVSFPLPSGQSLDAENVVTRLDIWHLLAGRVEVDDVIVEHPTLVLTGDGLTPALAVAPIFAAAQWPELRIVDGTIAWRSEGGLTRELVSGLTANLDRVVDGRGISLGAAFDWRDERVTVNLVLDDAAGFLSGTPSPARVVLAATGAEARFQGRAALGTAPVLTGTLSAEADALRDLLDWAGIEPPTRGGLGPFALSAHLALEDGGLSLTDASLDLDGNRGDGAFLLKLVQGRPVLQGTFAADKITLTPYGGIHLTTDDGRNWDRRPIDLSPLEGFDLDLRLSAGRVVADETTLNTVAASAVLTGGRLVMVLGEATGWGGLLRASLSLAPGAPDPALPYGRATGAEVRLEAEATDVDLGRTLEDIAGMRRIEGTGTLQVEVSGAGGNVVEIARTLTGNASISAGNGYLAGLDVAQVLQRIERRPLSATSDARGGRTAFTDLSGRIAITDGVGTVEEMQLQGKQVRLGMEGSISIAERSLDLAGHASLVLPSSKSTTSGVDLPFSVRGPWDTPMVMADPLSLIERSGAALPLLEAVKGRAGTAAAEPAMEGAPGRKAAPPTPPAN